MFIVYQIRNIENNYIYIGSTKKFKSRINRHLNELRKNTHHCIYLQRAFNLYGENKFVFEILFIFDNEKDMLNKESILIQDLTGKYNTSKVVSGGDLVSYHPNLDLIKKKHSENYKKVKEKNNGIHPFQLIDNHGINNNNWKHGKYCDNKYCVSCNKKISINANKCSSCTAKLRLGSKNPFYGKKHTEETIAKIKQNKHLQKLPSNTLKVIIDGIIYDSASKASKYVKCSVSSILNRCRNEKFNNYQFYDEG